MLILNNSVFTKDNYKSFWKDNKMKSNVKIAEDEHKHTNIKMLKYKYNKVLENLRNNNFEDSKQTSEFNNEIFRYKRQDIYSKKRIPKEVITRRNKIKFSNYRRKQ